MTARRNSIDDAGRRASGELRDVLTDGRQARLARGLSQAQVATALGFSSLDGAAAVEGVAHAGPRS